MDIKITPSILRGTVTAIPSKSQAHRILICAAIADRETQVICPETNQDIEATVECLNALGAHIKRTETGYTVTPIRHIPARASLPCGESGSTLRFMLPFAGALGTKTIFILKGRLPQRPLSPLWEEMERMGCCLTRPSADTIQCTGKLQGGEYHIAGNISSQFITGLMLAMPLMEKSSRLIINGTLESAPYVHMTADVMSLFKVQTDGLQVTSCFPLHSPGSVTVEGDWSNAAFFLAANSLGNSISVMGLNEASSQGDRSIMPLLDRLRYPAEIAAQDIPDLVPVLAVAAATQNGAVFTGIRRLRLKESDRVESVRAMLTAMGIQSDATEDSLTVYPGQLHGGTVDSVNDHRIAMAAAIAATAAVEPVTILNAQCVRKSYPGFWEDYKKLGGNYEQYIR